MTTVLYSMINNIAKTVNSLIERQHKLEHDLQVAVDGPLGAPRSIAEPLQPTNTPSNAQLMKRITDIEASLSAIVSSQSRSMPSALSAPDGQLKSLSDDMKNIKSTIADSNKDKLLLETALTHKFEQHINRVFKERMESTVKDTQLTNKNYVDQQVAEVKTLLNNAVSLIASQQQALATNINDHISDAAGSIDIDVEKIEDFEIDMTPAKDKSKRMVRKKN